jgi:hypothetical protein
MTIYINNKPLESLTKHPVRHPTDFHVPARSDVAYYIDSQVDMGSTSVIVPATGITVKGDSPNLSKLYSSHSSGDSNNPYVLFKADVGGSGTVFLKELTLTTSGLKDESQVFDLSGTTGFEAIEMTEVNFEDCNNLGEINNYRQGLETITGRYGGTPTLTLSGTWLGGYKSTTTNALNLDATFSDSLFKAGVGFTMNNRFYTDINVDLPTNASFFDASPSNFTKDSLVQIRGAIFLRDGETMSGDNAYLPSLDPDDLVCSWYNNVGLRNTNEGGINTVTSEATTTISDQSTYYDVAGVFTPTRLQHFSGASTGTLTNLGVSPIEFNLNASLTVEGTANDSVSVKIVRWVDDLQQFEDVVTQPATINSLSGPRDVAFVVINYGVTLEKNDYLKIQLANLTGTGDLTLEEGSYIRLRRG